MTNATSDQSTIERQVASWFFGPMLREAGEGVRETAGAVRDITNGLVEDAHEFNREVVDAWDDQPTFERKVAVASYEVFENYLQSHVRHVGRMFGFGRELVEAHVETALHSPVVNGVRAGAAGVARGAMGAAGEVVETVGENWSRTIDQAKEDAREIGGAGVNVATTWVDNVRELGSEVADAWSNDTTIERKIAGAGYEVVENVVQGAIRNTGAQLNVVKEVGEAAVGNVVTGWQNLGNSIAGGVEAVGGFFGGLFGD